MLIKQELLIKFPTKLDLSCELKRIKPIKQKYFNLSRWGNVEARERWRYFCKYEKLIKEIIISNF